MMEGLLGHVLRDPATGLPNIPYFEMIRDWEAKRAERREATLSVLDVAVDGGGEMVRRSLSWRICQALRRSDLIASRGGSQYRILLTSPDAENAEQVAERLAHMACEINERHPDDPPLSVRVAITADERAA